MGTGFRTDHAQTEDGGNPPHSRAWNNTLPKGVCARDTPYGDQAAYRSCSNFKKPRHQGKKHESAGIQFAAVLAALSIGAIAPATAQSPPPFATTKVEGTDNVYIFRNGGHQSMFVVTKAGVIATDPIGYGRPTGGQTYVDEIKKVTNQPIKYLIYSHHHYDHIAGGKAFKDAGARIIAHKNVKMHLAPLGDPNTVLPDESFDGKKTITLGGTTLELLYLGPNHSDSNIVMRLPKEKIVFVVDTIPVGAFPGRGFIDIEPFATETVHQEGHRNGLGERMIPGHPGQPGGRLGTKQDAQNVLALYAGSLRRDEGDWARAASAGTPPRRNSRCRNTPRCRATKRVSAWWRGAIAACGAAAPDKLIPCDLAPRHRRLKRAAVFSAPPGRI